MSISEELENAIPMIKKTTWTLWVLVCGINPVLLSIAGFIFSAEDLSKLHISMTQGWCLIFGLPLAAPFLQYLVLRRFALHLSFGA